MSEGARHVPPGQSSTDRRGPADLRRRRVAVVIALALGISLGSETTVLAANACVWNASSGANWNSSGNWTSCGSTTPQAVDSVTFGSSKTGTCTINTTVNVASITIQSGAGTVSQGANTVTTSGAFTQAGGTFTGGSSDITIGGDLALSSGTFTSTTGLLEVDGAFNKTGGTFTHNSGQVMLSSTSSQTFASNGATFNDLTINDGLIGYWKLDETATPSADSSGYGLDATWSSSPSGSATVPTVNFTNSHSLSVDSASDTASFTSPDTTIITIAAWVKATAIGGGNYQRIIDMPGYYAFIGTSGLIAPDNPMSVGFADLRTTTGGDWRSPSNSITYAAWHHVAITYDSSSTGNNPTFYIDGVSQTTTVKTAPAGTQQTNAGTGYIGNRAALDRYFNGLIDDLRIYNRALTATEIYSLYIGNQPGTSAATQTLTGNPIVAGDLVIASGTLAAGTTSIQVAGNWWNYGGLFTAGSTGLVTFNGSSGSHTIRSGGQTFGGITVNGSGNTWTLGARLDMNPASTLTVTAGTLDLSSYTLRTGNVDKTAAVALTPSTGTVVLDGNTSATTDQGTFYNLRVEPVAATNLVGYWKLDAGQGLTARDFSGNGNDLTLTNGPLWTASGLPTAVTFDNPAALTFAGASTQYASTASLPAALQPSVVTMSAWYKATSVDSLGGEVVSGSNRYILRAVSSTQVALLKQTASSTWVVLTATVTTPLDGNWHHLAGVINASGMEVYYDGVSKATNADTTAIYYTSATTLNVGRNPASGSYDFTGTIDDVRIYNTTLTAAQVAALAAGTYPTGLSGTPTYTLGANTTVTGTLSMDSGTLASSSYTMNASTAANVATVYSGTYSVGSTTNTFAGGLTVNKYGTLDLPTDGGVVQIGPTTATTKVLTIDGTLSGSGTTGGTIQKNSGANNYTFTVGSSATATPTLDITRLAVKNTDTSGMNINVNHSSVTTFNSFDNIAFSSGTGNYLLQIYSTSLALYGNGLTFDASTTSNLKLQGNGTGDGETRTYLGATCTNTPCESYDADDDTEPDGTGDTGALGDEAVAQWLHTAYDDTAGSIQGFPTTAFNWTDFTYWNTYVVFRDYSGSTDRLFARDTDGAFKTTAGGAGYYWDLPSSVGDITGVPRWTMEGSTHYVYVVTTLGYVYKLSDSGTAFALVTAQAWPYHNGASATATSALAMDSSNVYWAGNDGAGARKMFSLTTAMVLNGTRTVVADVVASPSLNTISGTTYLFTGTNGKIYRTPTDLSSELTSTQATSIVYGRVTVIGGTVYFPEDIGKVWALSGTTLATTWSYQDTNAGRHPGGCSANSQCTVRNLYVDVTTGRTYFGDKDGHVYVLTSAGAVINANYPYRPGASTDEFQTAPLYRSGVIVIGSTTGKVFVIDQNNGTGPAVYQTFNFQSAISTIAYDTDGYYIIGTADGKLYYLNGVTDPTSGST